MGMLFTKSCQVRKAQHQWSGPQLIKSDRSVRYIKCNFLKNCHNLNDIVKGYSIFYITITLLECV